MKRMFKSSLMLVLITMIVVACGSCSDSNEDASIDQTAFDEAIPTATELLLTSTITRTPSPTLTPSSIPTATPTITPTPTIVPVVNPDWGDVVIESICLQVETEELDWCKRFKDAGWHVVYLPAAQIVHYGGKSSDQVVTSRHIHFQTSKVRYFRKFHGRFVGELLRWFLLGNYVWQLGVEGAKWLIGHKRPLRAKRVAAYRQVLRSGLRGDRS